MIFRAAPVKSETTFVKQNRKLVQTIIFRFHWRGAEHVELFDLFSEIEVLGVRFEKLRFLFCWFRCAPPKIWNHIVEPTFNYVPKMWSQIFQARVGTLR